MLERKWSAISQSFATDGTTVGSFTVADPSGFRVKQRCEIRSDTQSTKYLEIKRVIGTVIYVGEIGNITLREDISAFIVADNALIRVNEQGRPGIDPKHIFRAVYEEEPVVAIRTIDVDEEGNLVSGSRADVHDGYGNPIDSEVIGGDRYLNVNANLEGVTITAANLDVHLSHLLTAPDGGDSVRIGDGIDTMAVNSDGSINVALTSAGTPIIHKENNTFTDTSETTVATYTTAQNNTKVQQILGIAETFGVWRLYKNAISIGNKFAEFRTSEFENNVLINFAQEEDIASSGTNVYVTFQAHRYRSGILGISGATFVRLEGYY